MSNWKQHPLLLNLKTADEHISSGLFLATNNQSPLAQYRSVMQMLEYSAHGIPWLLGTCSLIWFVTDRDLEAFYVNLLIALVLDLIAVAVIKAVARRKRPPVNVNDMFFTVSVDNHSFPSGHASRVVFLACLFLNYTTINVVFKFVTLVWSLSVIASRVLLGRHYVGDVVVVGGAVGVAAYFWLRRRATAAGHFVPVGHLANISIHPIKSLAGVDVSYADCTVAGPAYKGLKDRQILVVKGDSFVSMREEPRLGMIRVAFDEAKLALTLTADGYPPLTVDACDPEEQRKPSFTVKVRMFSYKGTEVSQEATDWFRNYLKHDDARLVAFQDESAFNVLSKASLDGLLSKLPAGTELTDPKKE
ncbi:hypothetical protein HPB52_008104 [Rhipicephalus sanguineus]|uniref:Phosphatidic acid phosphatase type 2/haloperoxidase domain-containing protein n=1 Tax=Rhipicephalus sanguineus TaxID=34632 RepID=A0A9D4QLZ5_RHISA|nr:hypothetical protein HPB52_008104 [Rhipicephalus sanguineus]